MKADRPRITVMVENGKLVAGSAYDQEMIDGLPLGRLVVEVDTTSPEDGIRNLIMAGVGVLYDNISESGPGHTYPTKDHLRRALLRAIGFAEPIHRVDGIKLEARSMARDKMSYEELTTVLELLRTHCFERWGFDPFEAWTDEKDAEIANRRRSGR